MPKTKPAKDKGPTVQIAIRLDPSLIARLDAVAGRLSRPGLELTRTDAVRVCLQTGLVSIEKEK